MASCYSELSESSDEDLVHQTLEGSMAAFDEIVRRYQQMLAASLHHLCRNPSDLEELVQETFVRSFRKLRLWKPQAPLFAWIRRIGHNLCYDYLRRQKRNPLAMQRLESTVPGTDPAGMDRLVDESIPADDANCRNDLIHWLLRQLKPDEAMVVTLLHVQQCSVTEIVERTGWSPSKVKVKAHRARRKLQQIFESHEELRLQYTAPL